MFNNLKTEDDKLSWYTHIRQTNQTPLSFKIFLTVSQLSHFSHYFFAGYVNISKNQLSWRATNNLNESSFSSMSKQLLSQWSLLMTKFCLFSFFRKTFFFEAAEMCVCWFHHSMAIGSYLQASMIAGRWLFAHKLKRQRREKYKIFTNQ